MAGALLGAALCVKPQLLFLLPAGLIAARAWRVLLFTGLAGAALCLASVLLFGLDSWRAWLHALSDLQGWEAQQHLRTVSLAPHAGLPLRGLLVVAGCAVTALAFLREDLGLRLTAVVTASVLCAPHAMPYDLSVVAPAALGAMTELSLLSLAGLALFAGAVATPWALLGYAAAWLPPVRAILSRARFSTRALRQGTVPQP